MERVTEIIENGEFEVYGIRVIDGPAPEVGATLDASRVWIDGTPTADLLDGVSAVEIDGNIERALKIAADYYGATLVLLGDFTYTRGEDDGEVVLPCARVLAVWTR